MNQCSESNSQARHNKDGGMNKLIIYDPVCMTNSGHNSRACRLFYEQATKLYDEVIVIHAGAMVGETLTELVGIPQEDWLTCGYDLLGTDGDKKIDPISIFKKSKQDLLRCLEKHVDSSIFILGCDFYTFSALCLLCKEVPELVQGRIILRFIGVLENDTRSDHNKGRFFDLLHKHAKLIDKLGIRIIAETMFYAEFLSSIAGVQVDVCPYPMKVRAEGRKLKQVKDTPLCVGLIGAPRREKGYFKIASLATQLQLDKNSATFLIQCMKLGSPEFLANYSMFLHSQPNVESLPSYLSEDEMVEAFATSDYQLLAYEPSIYRYRGSAILFEAVQEFCPVLALSGNAFAREVEHFGIGYVFKTEAQLVEMLRTIPKPNRQMDEKLAAFQKWADTKTASCMAC